MNNINFITRRYVLLDLLFLLLLFYMIFDIKFHSFNISLRDNISIQIVLLCLFIYLILFIKKIKIYEGFLIFYFLPFLYIKYEIHKIISIKIIQELKFTRIKIIVKIGEKVKKRFFFFWGINDDDIEKIIKIVNNDKGCSAD